MKTQNSLLSKQDSFFKAAKCTVQLVMIHKGGSVLCLDGGARNKAIHANWHLSNFSCAVPQLPQRNRCESCTFRNLKGGLSGFHGENFTILWEFKSFHHKIIHFVTNFGPKSLEAFWHDNSARFDASRASAFEFFPGEYVQYSESRWCCSSNAGTFFNTTRNRIWLHASAAGTSATVAS